MLRHVGVLAVCAGVLVAGAPAATTASADADISIGNLQPPDPVAGRSFSIRILVGNSGPDSTHYRLFVDLPEGLTFLNGLDCTGTRSLVCADGDAPPAFDGSGTIGLSAAAPGTYTIGAHLGELSAADPNVANNQASITVTVAAAAHALAAARVRVVPARPRAGSRFAVSFAVLDRTAGHVVAPTSAACTAKPGHARARVARGRAVCVVTTGASARGRTVHGALAARAALGRATRRFAVRLR